jgi:HlyD family secretion protein
MRVSIPFSGASDRSGATRFARRRLRWLFIPLILIIAAGAFFGLRSRSTTTATTSTATVSQGDLIISVTGSGAVAAARTVELPFQQQGTITAVDVRVGDNVTAGQTLATIDPADLQLQLQQAQADLKSAEAKLSQAQHGSATEQDLVSAQASLESAKAQLDQTRQGSATSADIQSAQAALAAAQAKLDALKNPSPAVLSAAKTQLAQAQTNAQTQRDNLSQAKTSAYNQMQQAVNSLTQAQSKYATAKKNWDYIQATGADPTTPTRTDSRGETVKNKLSDTQRQQYYDTYVQAEAALRSAETTVAQAQLSYDTARQQEAAEVPLLSQQTADAQAQLDALLNPTASDLRQAEASVVQARANLDKLRQGGTVAEVTQAQAQVTQAQSNLESLSAPASAPDLAAAEAGLIQAQTALATAQRNLEQATLKAPFDGVVSAVAVQEGGLASSGTAAITLVDRSKLHIEVNLSESDVAKVQLGQPVALTFDALPDVTIKGTVATIAPAATVEQNVVTYPVQVEFEPGETPVKVGMSATADIQLQQISDAILVPSRAVQTSGDTKTITLLQGPDQTPKTIQVETGVTNNGQTALISCVENGTQCLQPGDIVSVSASGTTSSTTSTQSGNRGSNLGGPPPFGP